MIVGNQDDHQPLNKMKLPIAKTVDKMKKKTSKSQEAILSKKSSITKPNEEPLIITKVPLGM